MIHEAAVKVLLLLSATPIQIIEKIKSEHDQLELVVRPTCEFKPEHGQAIVSKFGKDTKVSSISKCHQSVLRSQLYCRLDL